MSNTLSAEESSKLARKMNHPILGVSVRDRKYHLRKYPQCFVGSEAVDWLVKELQTSREEAIKVGQDLLGQRLFEHVAQGHHFKDDYLFYRFSFPRKLVIVGGGFAGSKIASEFENEFATVLIDEKPFFQCLPSLPTLLVDPLHSEKIHNNHTDYLKKTRVLVTKVVEVSDSWVLTQDNQQIEFDYLVLSMGSRYSIPNFRSDAVANCIDHQEINRRYEDLVNAQNIVVIGGGPVGVEVAGEIAAKWPNKHVTLLSRGRLLERCCPAAHSTCEKLFQSQFHNVTLQLGERLKSVENGEVVTDLGNRIPADMIYPCMGFIPNTEPLRQHFGDCLSDRGLVTVNVHTLQMVGHPNIFACGDIADTPEEKLAQTAEAHAAAVIKSLKNAKTAESLDKLPNVYEPSSNRLMIVSIGPGKAVMVRGEKVMTDGMMASKLKSIVEWKTMRSRK